MKKTIFILSCIYLTACSSTPKSKLNCEKLHKDSEAKLEELQQIFSAYQTINYDLALKLAPPLKEQVSELDSRLKKQKQRCWPSEKREVDGSMAQLREELFKVYGDIEVKKMRAPASVVQAPAVPVLSEETKPEGLESERKESPADFVDLE